MPTKPPWNSPMSSSGGMVVSMVTTSPCTGLWKASPEAYGKPNLVRARSILQSGPVNLCSWDSLKDAVLVEAHLVRVLFLDRSKLVWFDIWGYICLKGEWSPTKPSRNHLNNQPHCTRIHAWAFLGPPLQQPLPFYLYTHSSTYLLSYFTQFLHFWC